MKPAFLDICRTPDAVLFQYEDSPVRFEEPDSLEERREKIDFTVRGGALAVTLSPQSRPYLRVKLRWDGDLSSAILCLGDSWERIGLGTLSENEGMWTGMDSRRRMPWYFHLYDGVALHSFGIKTGPAVFAWFECDTGGISLWLDVRAGREGLLLCEPLLACEVVARRGEEGEDPYAAACAFCRMMCEKPNLPREPLFGVNNWYWAYGNVTHDSVLNECDYLMEMARDAASRPAMIIDDGWQLHRKTGVKSPYIGGPWTANAGFPEGMAATADAIRERGARPGIWMRPLLSCGEIPSDAILSKNEANGGLSLDPSHPFVLERVEADVGALRAAGFAIIKHDFTSIDIGANPYEAGGPVLYDKHHPTAYTVRELYRRIERAAGGADVIGCSTYGHLAAGIHAIQRVGGDTSGRNFEITRKDGIGTFARLPQNGTLFSHDPDCAAFTARVPHKENLDFLEVAAITGATTLASVTPGSLTGEEMARIQRIYKIASEGGLGAVPTDWLGHNEPSAYRTRDGRMIFYDWYGFYRGVRSFVTWFD